MTENPQIKVVKKSELCAKLERDKWERAVQHEAIQELEALDTELGRIIKRIAALRDILKAA